MSEKTKGLTRLTDLEAAEVSFVPMGANRRRFIIYKSAGEKMAQPNSEMHKLISNADPEVMKKVQSMLSEHAAKSKGVAKAPLVPGKDASAQPAPAPSAAAPASPTSSAPVQPQAAAPGAENSPGAQLDALDPQAETALKAIIRIAAPFKDKLPAPLLAKALEFAGYHLSASGGDVNEAEDAQEDSAEGEAPEAGQAGEGEQPAEKSSEGDSKNVEGDKPAEGDAPADGAGAPDQKEKADPKEKPVKKEDVAAAMDKAHGAYKEHMEAQGYEKYPAPSMGETKDGNTVKKAKGELVSKEAAKQNTPDLSAVDPKTRETLETIFKSNQELITKNAELEKRLADGEAKAREKEVVAKAAEFKHVALAQEEVVAMLKDADKLGSEAYERVCKNFSALNEQGKSSGLFKEIGSSLPSSQTGSEDAWAKIEKAAQGWVAKSGERLTSAQAVEKFLETSEGSKMYSEYKAGRKDGI